MQPPSDKTPYSVTLNFPIPCRFDISQLTIDGERVTYERTDGYVIYERQNRASFKAVAKF